MEESRRTGAGHARRQSGPGASEQYAGVRNDVAVLMDCIQLELDDHARRASERPEVWSYVKSMAGTRKALKSLLQKLLISRHEMSWGQAEKYIDDHLDAMRGSN